MVFSKSKITVKSKERKEATLIILAIYHRYVSLSDNEKTGFKARELKSVHVDAIGTYLRITFHRNHINRYNVYNQVLY